MIEEGTKYSHVFLVNALLMTFFFINMIMVVVGAHKLMVRLIAGYCAIALCIAHFCTLIATAVYRFRAVGRLCTYVDQPSNAPNDKPEDLNDDWTLKKDASLILALWIIQLLGCCSCLATALNPLRVPMTMTAKLEDGR